MLTRHFSIAEAEKSHVAIRHGLDNTLPEHYRDNAVNVARHILEPCREHFGKSIVPSSWFRGAELNAAVRGSRNSQHCTASAVDFEIGGVDNMKLADYIADNLEFDQLILEYFDGSPSSGWIHCSYAQNNRGSILRTRDGKTYEKGIW